jgi:hypothetical protein
MLASTRYRPSGLELLTNMDHGRLLRQGENRAGQFAFTSGIWDFQGRRYTKSSQLIERRSESLRKLQFLWLGLRNSNMRHLLARLD